MATDFIVKFDKIIYLNKLIKKIPEFIKVFNNGGLNLVIDSIVFDARRSMHKEHFFPVNLNELKANLNKFVLLEEKNKIIRVKLKGIGGFDFNFVSYYGRESNFSNVICDFKAYLMPHNPNFERNFMLLADFSVWVAGFLDSDYFIGGIDTISGFYLFGSKSLDFYENLKKNINVGFDFNLAKDEIKQLVKDSAVFFDETNGFIVASFLHFGEMGVENLLFENLKKFKGSKNE